MSLKPKVLLGVSLCDRYDYCLDKFLDAVKKLDYDDFDLVIIDNSSSLDYCDKLKSLGLNVVHVIPGDFVRGTLVKCRNYLRSKALSEGYDYLFTVDSDVILPSDVLTKLISHNKKVVCGLYYSRYKINGIMMTLPVLWKFDGENIKFFLPEEVEKGQLLKIRATGSGCMLIHKDILKDFEFRWDEKIMAFDDVFFCEDLIKAGQDLYCDTSIKCFHWAKGKSWQNVQK
ncbi:MAG: glycosyltransferase [archaeon]